MIWGDERLRQQLIQSALDWNLQADGDAFAIAIPNTSPPLYVALGAADSTLVGPHPVDGEDEEPAANDPGD